MLRLPRMNVTCPDTVEQAIAAMQTPGARIVAGGTDILPNLKHRLEQPPVLISLRRVKGLGAISVDDAAGVVSIGARVTLTELSEHEIVGDLFPSLAKAAGTVASPLIRNMGTIGGNVNLDTRCRYVNQTEFWRTAIGGCLKSEGDVCHVVPKGNKCVAAMSSDCVPVLISLDAEIELAGPDGTRRLPLAEYYLAEGRRHTTRADGELMTKIVVPLPHGVRRCGYAKWTVRKSIDFPLVSVAVRFDLSSKAADATIDGLRVVVGVLGAKPRQVTRIEGVVGRSASDPLVPGAVAQRAHAQCKPLENVPYEAPYRRQMIRVHTRRVVSEVLGSSDPR